MTGKKRVETIERLLKDVFQKNVGGDIIETGVWRGGSSIFARGVVRVYDQVRSNLSVLYLFLII